MRIADLLFPPKCAACDTLLDVSGPEVALCESCNTKWELAKALCRRESRGQPMAVYNDELLAMERGGHVLYLVYYVPHGRRCVQNSLILDLKDYADRRVVAFCAEELEAMLRCEVPLICKGGARHEDTVIAWIPRRRASVVKYGFDHMERIAKALAKRMGLEAMPFIGRRMFTSEQKLLNTEERRFNAQKALRFLGKERLDGKLVLLIDDIITSGASFNAAAQLLLDAGAEQVIAAAIAMTEHPID